jgi:hypothetical protein
MYKRTSFSTCVFVIVGFAGAIVTFGQTSPIISVSDPRALAQAALQLEGLIGIAINYEDVPYIYAGDIQDVAESVMSPEQKAAHPVAHVWVPRNGQISLDLSKVPGFAEQSALSSAGTLGSARLIDALITQHVKQNLPGVYTSTSSNGAFYITPTQLRGALGSLTNASPALDAKVTLAYQERTAGETLDAILKQVSQSAGVQIALGRAPFNALATTRVSIGANDEAARSVISRLLLALASRTLADGSVASLMAYHLYYDPGMRYYMMNIHGVPQSQSNGVFVATPASTTPTGQANPYSQKK